MSSLAFRLDVIRAMGRSELTPGIDSEIREDGQAHAHVRQLLTTVASYDEPWAALDSLYFTLHDFAEHDGALGWLELTKVVLARADELPTAELIAVIGELRTFQAPAALNRLVPENTRGLRRLTGQETLPELLVRIVNRPDPDLLDPLVAFLRALGAHPTVACRELPALRHFVKTFGRRIPAPRTGDAAERLIIQVRLDEATAPGKKDSGYRLHISYYRQPLAGGRFRRVGSLDPKWFAKSELVGDGSARLNNWMELRREMRESTDPVRIEFLLPHSILGHAAELWSSETTRRPLGRFHPVVVRSLERYTEHNVNFANWRTRWEHLNAAELDDTERVGWPSLDPAQIDALSKWLDDHRKLACLGLNVPYEELDPDVRDLVDDAMIVDGVPVLIWRRTAGHADPLVATLRGHGSGRLAELPETVHHYREKLRTKVADAHHTVTLLWEDPDCVDPDQDGQFPGMVG
ncbi:hypothetical protein [Kitasatospora sp. NPDC093806]|uniref:VMAP-C domain-containing protein n=1 Tax=Kitasatospora sp. NPDC093806 TaxID=3155075 RepID=UPI00341B8E0B